jgi:hypothetical protein
MPPPHRFLKEEDLGFLAEPYVSAVHQVSAAPLSES